jgi:hypothetical protein
MNQNKDQIKYHLISKCGFFSLKNTLNSENKVELRHILSNPYFDTERIFPASDLYLGAIRFDC